MITLENMPVGTILKDKERDDYSRCLVLARLNEGKDSVYLISYDDDFGIADDWYTAYELSESHVIDTPPSDVIEVDGKKYTLIKEVE